MAIQKGKVWLDGDGQSVPTQYLPKHTIDLERVAGRLTALVENLEKQVRETKAEMARLMLEAIEIQNTTSDPVQTNAWRFYSFDGLYRFHIDQKKGYIWAFRAQKPKARDDQFDRVILDFTQVSLLEEIPAPEPDLDPNYKSPLGDQPDTVEQQDAAKEAVENTIKDLGSPI